MIQQWWNMGPTYQDLATSIILKLRMLRSYLKRWNQLNVGNILVQKDELLQKIDHLDIEKEKKNLFIAKIEERKILKLKLDLLLNQEEMIW